MNLKSQISKEKSPSNSHGLSPVKSTENSKSLFLVLMISLFSFCGVNTISAQDSAIKDDYQPISIGLSFENMHLWHGFVVTPNATLGTNMEFNSRNKKFSLGLWGGASFSSVDITANNGNIVAANYKELAIYTTYRFSNKLYVEAVSHNNYTGVEERGDKLNYWSYDKTQGYNFVDLSAGYQASKKTSLYLATILGGGSGDYETQSDGTLKDSYTHYLEIKNTVWEKGDNKFSVFAGGAWSFLTDKTFYTAKKANFVNVGAVFSKPVKIAGFEFPVDVTAMWNPEAQKAVLQLNLKLF